ncbi:hypothetical protein ACFCV8_16780 [Streptomyces sp. NPDC056347]|uniref:hypothetical protein n=1 Tax=Streptomyces sp. NPDC056347 TaxID=3345790 RepID=UPI0035E0AFC1
MSRGRDRWTAGSVGMARVAVPDTRPGARSGVIRRMRTGCTGTGAVGAGFEGLVFRGPAVSGGVAPVGVALLEVLLAGVLPAGVAFRGVAFVAALFAVRWTGAAPGVAVPGPPGAAEARSGRPADAFGDFCVGPVGVTEGSGVPGPCPCAISGCGPAAPDRVRPRPPSSGASLPSRAVDGSDGSGVPIPPRARACAADPPGRAGCADRDTGFGPSTCEAPAPGADDDRGAEGPSAVLPAGPCGGRGEDGDDCARVAAEAGEGAGEVVPAEAVASAA